MNNKTTTKPVEGRSSRTGFTETLLAPVWPWPDDLYTRTWRDDAELQNELSGSKLSIAYRRRSASTERSSTVHGLL